MQAAAQPAPASIVTSDGTAEGSSPATVERLSLTLSFLLLLLSSDQLGQGEGTSAPLNSACAPAADL